MFTPPIIELHISSIHEKLHRHSIMSGVAMAVGCGLGTCGNIVRLQSAARMVGGIAERLLEPVRVGPV